MNRFIAPIVLIAAIIFLAGCRGKSSSVKGTAADTDTVSVPDTGYTGIKQYLSSNRVIREVTFKNGVRDGLTKTFYPGGQLYQTFWYENGFREDSSVWYFVEGQVFRTTPYKRDTVDGIQKQYYRTGKPRAMIGYNKGLRTTFLEEYDQNGRVLRNYPEIVTEINDEYSSKGLYRITLSMSDNTDKVKFYRGDLNNGRFDTTMVRQLDVVNGKAVLALKKTDSPKPGYTGVISETLTQLGNRNFIYKKIELPYNDLN